MVNCGGLDSPNNGLVTESETTVNYSANYSCNTGYELRGDATRVCLANGLWSGNEPTCIGIGILILSSHVSTPHKQACCML